MTIELFEPPGEGERDPSMVDQLIQRTGRKQEIDELANDIKSWADHAFPDRSDQSMFFKLYQEIGELADAEGDNIGHELADVIIMLLDYGKRKRINIAQAVRSKLEINKSRKWEQGPNGTFRHIKE
jgi:NTP pyrophosphatase (non-canonical NTP hydrolase)